MRVASFSPVQGSKHVEELAKILKRNGLGKDAKGLMETFKCINTMEHDLKKALSEITTLRAELSTIQEEQKHPIKTMLHKTADSLITQLKSIYRQIIALKDKFIGSCKQAVEGIKDKVISVANNAVNNLNVKGELEKTKASANKLIDSCERKIANIETASKEYHTIGRAIKNFGLALLGRETVPAIKPNGKLAKMLQAPFNAEIRGLKSCIANVDRALVQIDKLEKTAEQRAERKPSVLDEMAQHKIATREKPEPTISVPAKVKTTNQEL